MDQKTELQARTEYCWEHLIIIYLRSNKEKEKEKQFHFSQFKVDISNHIKDPSSSISINIIYSIHLCALFYEENKNEKTCLTHSFVFIRNCNKQKSY